MGAPIGEVSQARSPRSLRRRRRMRRANSQNLKGLMECSTAAWLETWDMGVTEVWLPLFPHQQGGEGERRCALQSASDAAAQIVWNLWAFGRRPANQARMAKTGMGTTIALHLRPPPPFTPSTPCFSNTSTPCYLITPCSSL